MGYLWNKHTIPNDTTSCSVPDNHSNTCQPASNSYAEARPTMPTSSSKLYSLSKAKLLQQPLPFLTYKTVLSAPWNFTFIPVPLLLLTHFLHKLWTSHSLIVCVYMCACTHTCDAVHGHVYVCRTSSILLSTLLWRHSLSEPEACSSAGLPALRWNLSFSASQSWGYRHALSYPAFVCAMLWELGSSCTQNKCSQHPAFFLRLHTFRFWAAAEAQ